MRKKRLSPEIFNIPVEQIKKGYFSDKYFYRTKQILEKDNNHPRVLMQVFCRQNAILCGIDEAIAILQLCSDLPQNLTIKALYDGDEISPEETVMTIEGDYSTFAHLETIYLGVLARGTSIATATRKVVRAAGGKPILFFSRPGLTTTAHNFAPDTRPGLAAQILSARMRKVNGGEVREWAQFPTV